MEGGRDYGGSEGGRVIWRKGDMEGGGDGRKEIWREGDMDVRGEGGGEK